jgi:hypothetical protein
MRNIILGAIGLAMFATPLAAGTPHSGGYAQHELHQFGMERNAPPVHAQARPSERFLVAPADARSSSLSGQQPGDSYSSRPQNGIGVPYSAPPQGWPLNR